MKILHIGLLSHFTDKKMLYQDNMLATIMIRIMLIGNEVRNTGDVQLMSRLAYVLPANG